MLDSITELHPALQRGQVVIPGDLVLLHPESPDGSTWLALSPVDDVTVVTTAEVRVTADTVDEDALLRRVVSTQQLLTERSQLAEDRLQELRDSVLEMRSYAIDRQREGAFCRDGLNEALRHFGLEPYVPRYAVEVVVHATVEINADSEEEAQRRVRYVIDGLDHSGEDNTEEIEIRMTDLDVRDAEPV